MSSFGAELRILEFVIDTRENGYESCKVNIGNSYVKFTTIIVNDEEMVEFRVFDSVGDILFWRALPAYQIVKEFKLWIKDS